MKAGSGRDDVPLSVLLLIGFLHGLVVLSVLVKILIEEEVSVNDTEVVDQKETFKSNLI